MKILLVVPKYNQFGGSNDFYYMPLGMMYISSYLKSRGFDVRCLNLNHYEPGRLNEVLKEDKFDIVATGGLFIHLREIEYIVRRARRVSPDSKVILGGAIASGDAEFILRDLKVDYLVLGEGELSFENLLRAIEKNEDAAKLTGIAFLGDGRYVKTPPTPTIDKLDALPIPDYEAFEYGHYLDNYRFRNYDMSAIRSLDDIENRRLALVISSRDCVVQCTFCYRVLGGKYRVRSMDKFIEEIKFLMKNYGVNDIIIVDDLFSSRPERVYEFCEKVKPLKLGWACQFRVNIADDKLLGTMKDAGCYVVSYGFESGSQAVLKSMKKGIRVQQIEKAIYLTQKNKMTVQGNLIFGDPAETIGTFKETLAFRYKYRTTSMGFGMVIPYPGTVLYHDLIARGAIEDVRKFHLNSGFPPLNMTKLPRVDFLYLYRRVGLEGIRLRNFAKLTSVEEISKGFFRISAICPFCGTKNKDFHLKVVQTNKYIVTCKECYKRFNVDAADPRFGGSIERIKRAFRLPLLQILLYNHITHRFFFYPIQIAISVRRFVKGALRKLAPASASL